MTTVSRFATHPASAMTRNIFGRQVKPEEFESFKTDVLKTYAESDIQVNPDDIKPEFCFTRQKIPIPIIGRIVLAFQSIRDKRTVNKIINKTNYDEGEKIVVCEQTKRLLPYFPWDKWFFDDMMNQDFKKLANNKKPFDIHKIENTGFRLIETMFKDLKKFTIDLTKIFGEYRFHPEKKNQRYLVTQFTLKEKPEKLQT